jgi:hypothetical protein
VPIEEILRARGGSSMKIYLVSYTAKQRIRSSKTYTGDVIIETSGDMLTKDGIEQIREQMMEDMKFTKLVFINIIELKG